MGDARRPKNAFGVRDPTRVLVGAMVAVVLAFTGASTLSYIATDDIEIELASLENNALPSMGHLLASRAELRDVAAAADAYRVSVMEGWALAGYQRERLRTARAKFEDALSAYATTPFYPGEREVYDQVRAAMPHLDELTARLLEQADARDSEAARVTVYQQLLPATDAQLVRLGQLLELNASWAREHGTQIRDTRAHFRAVTAGLDALGVVLALIVTAYAVRTLRGAIRGYEERLEEAETSDRDRDVLAFRAATDIQAPILNLRLALEACEGRSPEEQRATLRRAVATLSRVERTFEALLAFARAGGQPTPGASADVAGAMGLAIERVRAEAERAGVDVTVEPAPASEVACDREVLVDAIAQLVRHALAGMGDAALRRVFLRAEDRGARVRVEVHDTGTGSDPGRASALFDGASRSSIARIGIELAAVRRAVERHGGAIGWRDDVGAGRRVWIELPRAAFPAVETEAGAERVAG